MTTMISRIAKTSDRPSMKWNIEECKLLLIPINHWTSVIEEVRQQIR